VRDIVAIEAEGDGSTLCLAPHLTRKPSSKSLREWEQRLPDRQFVRIHRSTIVNLDYVERLEQWSHASQHVYLRGLTEPMIMSRRFGARLRDRFGEFLFSSDRLRSPCSQSLSFGREFGIEIDLKPE